uniref:Uncharacterized protein n=1 Tax=Helianthus annuus TaxID=4232 RepID=A0A251U731_HELAN
MNSVKGEDPVFFLHLHHTPTYSQMVTKCESQIEASWTALEAWKSGNKVTKCESQIEASWTALEAWKSGNKVT